MKVFSFWRTLRGRLLLLAVGVELCMLTLLLANSLRLLHSAMASQINWQIGQIMPVMNASLRAPLAQYDFATVQAILDESRASQGIEYIAVTDTKGETVASSGWPVGVPLPDPSKELTFFDTSFLYDQVMPIDLSGQRLGRLHLGLNLRHIITARHNLMSQGIGIAAAELLLSTLILLLLGLWLTRHLSLLARASIQVASGNLTPPPLPEGNDDIGQLGTAFNTMSRAIAERVTELTTAKEMVEASETRLRSITDSARDAILMMDARGNISYWNAAAEQILGYCSSEAMGSNLHELIAPERFINLHLAAFPEFLRSGQGAAVGKTLELYARRKDGREIPISLSLSAVMLNEEWNAVGILRDISETKKVQAELEALNRSLRQRVEEGVAELRKKDQVLISQGRQAAMGEMIGNIAHQWRQPLNALSMLISNLQFAQMNDELSAEYLNESATTADRLIKQMSTTINDFRNFFNPDKARTHFSALHQIRQAVELVDASFKHNNITTSVKADKDCTLYGFPNEYSQVLLNLLSNARDAITGTGATSGRIVISLEEQGKCGVVTVSDSGGGIPGEVIDKIFEPYFSTKQMGSGIGLYMSKMIIERNMGGSITVRTIEGGSEFTVSMPVAEESAGEPLVSANV